jgi:hypothetical protein
VLLQRARVADSTYMRTNITALLDCELSNVILLSAPQDKWINEIRLGNSRLLGHLREVPIILLDMKGPSGIDTCLMLRSKGLEITYASPLIGDNRHSAEFRYLAMNDIRAWPMPYFPSHRFTELNPQLRRRRSGRLANQVRFAGHVYGYRTNVLSALVEQLGCNCIEFRSDLSPSHYLDFISSSTIGIDIRGEDLPTYRFHELCRVGSCTLIDYRPLALFDLPPDFVYEHLFYTDSDVAVRKARQLLFDQDLTLELGEALRIWYEQSHAPESYVRYLTSIVDPQKLLSPGWLNPTGPFLVNTPL